MFALVGSVGFHSFLLFGLRFDVLIKRSIVVIVIVGARQVYIDMFVIVVADVAWNIGLFFMSKGSNHQSRVGNR